MKTFDERGLTLVELLAASTMGLVIVLALGQMDVARVKLFEALRMTPNSSQLISPEATYALNQLLSDLKQSDRVVLRDLHDPDWVSSHVQVYLPATSEWVEYRWLGTEGRIEVIRENCAVTERFQTPGLKAFAVQFVDIAKKAPPGGEVFLDGRDNNVVAVSVITEQLDDTGKPTKRRTQFGSTTIPAIAYTNLGAVYDPPRLIDSGAGQSRSVPEVPKSCQ